MILLPIALLAAQIGVGALAKCRCTPTDACWPSQDDWNALNRTIDGVLLALKPVEFICHDPTYNEAACSALNATYTNAAWRADQPGPLQHVNWETYPPTNETCYIDSPRTQPCNQGRISLYSVAATNPAHIQKGVRFARDKNLRLAIKNTGHDWLGRSSARSSLQIWTHKLKGITFTDDFSPRGCSKRPGQCGAGPAVTIGAGVQLLELYEAAKARGLTVVGGGGGATVGAAGGYLQGGGHSLLANLRGASTDNALEFTVVTAQGDLVTANDHTNTDLFWALRGGGGGTFGVVTSATVRTFPDSPTVTVNFNLTLPSASAEYWSVIEKLHELLPAVDEAGGTGYFYLFPNFGPQGAFLLGGFFFADQTDTARISTLWGPFETYMRTVANNATVGFQTAAVPTYSDSILPLLKAIPKSADSLVFGSRLISRDFLGAAPGPKRLTDTLAGMQHPPGLAVIALVVAGGQVERNADVVDSALNPAFRRALLHVELLRSWTTQTSFADQAAIRRRLTEEEVPMLKALEPGRMGAYFNEADPDEPDWQSAFWGENYPRLRQVKQRWDGEGLFTCRRCVGSERWDEEGLCEVGGP